MQLTLRDNLMRFAHMLQHGLFPILEEFGHAMRNEHQRVAAVFASIPLERFVPIGRGWIGRPVKDRHAIACAFVAKAVLNLSTTRQLIERLQIERFRLQSPQQCRG